MNETSVKLEWAVPIELIGKLTRYRIQFSKDEFETDVNEWPRKTNFNLTYLIYILIKNKFIQISTKKLTMTQKNHRFT